VKLLLDTHAFLWWMQNDRRLPARARARISGGGEVLVSAVSIWEMAIKIALGRLALGGVDAAHLDDLISACGFRELGVTARHATCVATLALHHTDPFDRLLVAQARLEGATLVSRDPALLPYGVPVLWR